MRSFDKLLHGSLDNLPEVPLSIIRVFFSSTFTDMTEERNLLMREAVPELRRYCQDKAFEFEIVDMRWGVREDAAADHTVTDICLKEIESCQKYSQGPNFVLFVGDKYGSRPLPNAIPVTEFRLFRRIASWMNLKFETVEKWYLLDTNSVPPVYHIQPITTLLPYYNNMNPVNKSNRLMHQDNWRSDERNMRNVFHKVSVVALGHKQISASACEKYFISVTECEIQEGIYSYAKKEDRILCFQRTLTNINLEDKMAKRFTDLGPDGDLDEEARDLREKMRNEKLPNNIPEGQMMENTVQWTEKGIDPEDEEHDRYLNTFCESFKSLMQKQIDICIEEASQMKMDNHLMSEAFQHLTHCSSKCQCFCGFEEVIRLIFKMMKTTVTAPVVEEVKDPLIEDEKEDAQERDEKIDALDEDKDKMYDTEKEGGENDENVDEVDDDNVKLNDSEIDEDNNNQNARQKELETIKEHFMRLGEDVAPTVCSGDIDYDSGSDPTKNLKQELIAFKMSERIKHPIVIWGNSGSGKTALMARIAQLIKVWYPNSVILIRFLGTTPQSSSVRYLLQNVIETIWAAYKINRPTDMDFAADVIYLGLYLQALIWKVSSESKPLYILLDSIDQLAPLEQAHGLAWLPLVLPEHCSMLISIVTHDWGCLDSARRILPHKNLFVEIPPLNDEAANKVISALLHQKSRTITRPQRNFLLERFRECQSPLYLKMIVSQALSWRSHMEVKNLILGSTTYHTINHFFMLMERNHGITLVSKAFGYLTGMKQGISSSEIVDILSLDNEVLQDTYIYHLPPNPKHIRILPSLWSRILTEVKDYLLSPDFNNGNSITWYHRMFKEVATERYITEEVLKPLHRLTAQYFLGYWYEKIKPLRLTKGKQGWYPDNTRQVTDQPLIFKDGRCNTRKLVELPYHLALAGMWRDFHRETVCSIDWLVAKVNAVGVTELKADLMLMLKQGNSLSEIEEEDPEDQPPEEEEMEEEKGEEVEENMNDSDELFITENKKQEEKMEIAAEEEEEITDDAISEVQEQDYTPDLATALKDIEMLLDIVILGIDSLRQSANNVPVQIICQLGRKRVLSPGLRKLVDDSYRWMEENSYPLLIPQDACLPPPGEMLKATISAEIHLLGADRVQDLPVHLSKEDDLLYVIQQNSATTDTLLVLDLSQGGERVMIEDSKSYIHSLRFNGNKRFIIACLYKTPEKYDPQFTYRLYERDYLFHYTLEKEAKNMDVSNNGDIVAYADERICFVCTPKLEEKCLEIVYRLHHTETITNILFSPNAYYLLTFMPGDGFKVWVPRRGECTFTMNAEKKAFSITETSGKVVYITAKHHLLQVLSGYQKMTTVRICDLSTGDVLYQLNSPELSSFYSIDFMEVDDAEEFLLVSTSQTSLVNGNHSKSALLWDIETGKLVSRVSSEVPFTATKIVEYNNIPYILASQFGQPHVFVYTVGPRHRRLAGAKLIRTITGHNRMVIQILLSINDNRAVGRDTLMSVAADNTIKIWDLAKALTPEPKTKKIDLGATVNLTYTKDGGAIYFGTDKGYIVMQDSLTGETTEIATELEGPIKHMILSKNGRFLIAAVKNCIYVYYTDTGELEYTLESCHFSSISCIAENNNILIAGHAGMEGKGRIWDLSNGRTVKDVSFLYSFYQTAVNTKGTQYGVTMFEIPIMMDVFGTDDGSVNISMEQVDSMMSACSKLEFSPDNSMLASASNDGRIRIIHTESGRYLHTMMQRSSISALLFTWDSRYLLTSGYRSIYVWCIGENHPPEAQGQLEVKLTRHGNFITCMKLLLEDRFLVTASLDKTIALWNMKTHTTICTFRALSPIDVMAVAPDLSTIAFVPDRSANIAVLTLNQSCSQVLKGIPSVSVPPKVKKAQAVALVFSSQQVTQKTSTACVIL